MAHFQTMTDMAKSPEDVKKEVASWGGGSPGIKPNVPIYPYGLCISLDEESLKKLKLDGDLPEIGEMIHLCAMAKVTAVSQSETEDTEGGKRSNCRVELQITHLATENEDDEAEMAVQQSAARRKRFYGDGDGDEA